MNCQNRYEKSGIHVNYSGCNSLHKLVKIMLYVEQNGAIFFAIRLDFFEKA